MNIDDFLEDESIPLNVLLTKKCNFRCRFCVESTKENTRGSLDWSFVSDVVNAMSRNGLVSDVLLLGGEPLYYDGIIELISSLEISPILTTNGDRLFHDLDFARKMSELPLKALNLSLPHYDEGVRASLMRGRSVATDQIRRALEMFDVPLRVNVVLAKNYIDDLDEVSKMAMFCNQIGVRELKLSELTARNPDIHDFITDDVLTFNSSHHISIPVDEIRNKCHVSGGTHHWATIGGVDVMFNAPPVEALSGGRDVEGKHYHRVLFNDGCGGFSWRRDDGLISKEDLEKFALENDVGQKMMRI